jgi:GNAT superfamily N-acetyltransferase
VPSPLDRHLTTWLGQWPPAEKLVVTTAASRVEPGWDGQVHTVVGVASPEGTVLSVPPAILQEAMAVARAGGLDALGMQLGTLLGRPGHRLHAGVFRWSDAPTSAAVLPEAGTWLPFDDPRVPAWLRPFGGDVLIALSEDEVEEHNGEYAAGVGIKRHDRYGQELAVGTEERFAGLGLGRRLVAQAARRIVADGAVATYLHDPRNVASAKVAEAPGFPDRGWQVLGLWP